MTTTAPFSLFRNITAFIATFLLCPLAHVSAHDSWTNQPSALTPTGSSTPQFTTYAGGRFIMVGSNSTYRHSAAGTAAWGSANLGGASRFYSARGIATDGTNIVVSGEDNLVHLTTASQIAGLPGTLPTWTTVNPAVRTSGNTNPDLGRVRYINGQFVLPLDDYVDNIDYNNNSYTEVLTSPDGTTWTSHKFIANTTGNIAFDAFDVAFKPGASAGTGTYVITVENNRYLLVAPEDLSSATRIQVNGMSSSGQNIIYADGKFVMATKNGKIFTSTTGASGSWSQATLPVTTSELNDVFHDGARFVTVGRTVSGSNPTRPTILHSSDGITWAEAANVPSSSATLETVYRADGLWLTAGSGRTLFTSGTASVSPPAITALPTVTPANVGGNLTINATVTGNPAPTIEWLKNGQPIADGVTPDGSTIGGTNTATLTISGLSFSDAGLYSVRATNAVSTTISSATTLSLSASAGGAILTPYGLNNSTGGVIINGSTPAKSVVGVNNLATFTAAGGISYLPNVPVNYNFYGALNPSGTKALLGNPFTVSQLLVYDLSSETGTFLPAITFPLGPISAANSVLPSAIADNGDVAGVINDTSNQLWAFHYTAATQTYTVLGNVPNAGNEIATSIGGITADGSTVSGYERNAIFNGPFIWSTTSGFTLLPTPTNSVAANGDVRQISPDGRYTVGFGAASAAFGGGQAALRWDRGAALGAPVGTTLVKTFADSFADARWVINDGTVGGNVRRGFSFNDNRAAVWLPNGALIILSEYLADRYGLNTAGLTLNQVTSISADRKTLTGTATNASSFSEGWILTLPDPIDLISPVPDIGLRVSGIITEGGTQNFAGSTQIGGGLYPTALSYLANFGAADLSVTAYTVTGANAADFEISEDLTGTYGVGQSLFFGIRFNPKPGTPGTRTALLTIASNDPDTPSYTLNLAGTATAPPTPTAAEAALESYLDTAGVPANERGPLDDPDLDGLNNLIEFALGLPPMSPSSLPLPTLASGTLSLTYNRAQQTHVSYTVQVSSDLGMTDPWSASGVNQGTPDAGGNTTATIPVTLNPEFMRIEVSLNPDPA